MNTFTACAISGAILATSAVLVPAAVAGLDTCRGQAATVTPDSDGNLVGTPGPDVIVALSDQRVDAGGGDDLICVVASAPGSDVDAGAGDDTVDTTRSFISTAVSLGEGEDTFVGGRGDDSVWGSAPEGLGGHGINPLDTENDAITTGGGRDRVFSGAVGEPNADKITTGRGDDRIWLGYLDHDMDLDVGSGTNTAIVTLTPNFTAHWLINVPRRRMTFDEITTTWKGQLHRWYFTLADGSDPSLLSFFGTSGSDYAFASGEGLVPSFRMRGGNDWAGSLTTPGGRFHLGPGTDRLTLGKYDSVSSSFPIDKLRVDLEAHVASFDGTIDSAVSGVEKLIAGADEVLALGNGKADKITANGCEVVIRGRGGNDVLTRGHDLLSPCASVVSRLFGGPGGDILFGSQRTDDILRGGPGFDRARGMNGNDTCYAEVKRGCESP